MLTVCERIALLHFLLDIEKLEAFQDTKNLVPERYSKRGILFAKKVAQTFNINLKNLVKINQFFVNWKLPKSIPFIFMKWISSSR